MKKLTVIIPIIAMLLLSGCTSIEARQLEDETDDSLAASDNPTDADLTTTSATTTTTSATTTTTTTTTTTSATTTTTTTTTEATTTVPEEEITETQEIETTAQTSTTNAAVYTTQAVIENYDQYTFDEEDQEFLSETVFVGDSICSGLSVYGIISSSHVLAKGNVAARSIFEYTFSYNGSELELLTALVNSNPKNIVFSMGMNDVNMTSAEKFVENYTYILTMVASYLPDTRLIIAGITPVTAESNFVANSKIRQYNQALMDMSETSEIPVTVVDLFDVLANSNGALKSNYHSGDGIHLSPAAYYAYLWQICQTCLHSDSNADEADNAETAAAETDETDETEQTSESAEADAAEADAATDASNSDEPDYSIDEDVVTKVDVTAE